MLDLEHFSMLYYFLSLNDPISIVLFSYFANNIFSNQFPVYSFVAILNNSTTAGVIALKKSPYCSFFYLLFSKLNKILKIFFCCCSILNWNKLIYYMVSEGYQFLLYLIANGYSLPSIMPWFHHQMVLSFPQLSVMQQHNHML